MLWVSYVPLVLAVISLALTRSVSVMCLVKAGAAVGTPIVDGIAGSKNCQRGRAAYPPLSA